MDDRKMKTDIMALVMHAGWVGYQIGVGQQYNVAPTEPQLASLRDAIRHREEQIKLDPKTEHENWMKFKLSEGWKYGHEKNETAKTHPDLVPWDKLPDVEKRKDVQSIKSYELAKIARGLLG